MIISKAKTLTKQLKVTISYFIAPNKAVIDTAKMD